jgi:hypothetical protein
MFTAVHELFRWLTLADYEAEKEKASEAIVARYARGNICTQNGWYLDDEKLAKLSAAGDLAMKHLEKMVPPRAM